MRVHAAGRLGAAMLAAILVTSAHAAQTADEAAPPHELGNRANGRDYQPTPSEVLPRERAAGIRPPDAQRKASNQMLENMDKNLLRDEGQSTKSVPKLGGP